MSAVARQTSGYPTNSQRAPRRSGANTVAAAIFVVLLSLVLFFGGLMLFVVIANLTIVICLVHCARIIASKLKKGTIYCQ